VQRNRISLEGLQQLCDGIIGLGSSGYGPTSKKEKEAVDIPPSVCTKYFNFLGDDQDD